MHSLHPRASEASRRRHELAREIARYCPGELGREIALTGSVARGVADERSDIELNFWVVAMPRVAERLAWLREIGATGSELDRETVADGSTWSDFRFRGVPVEAGWQSISAVEDLLAAILRGEVTDHGRLVVASAVQQAVPLRGEGRLERWQQALARYPTALSTTLIDRAIEPWTLWHFPQDRIALAERADLLALAQELVWDVQGVVRIVFALNRRWEPDWKWLAQTSTGLAVRPAHLLERIGDIVTLPDPARRVTASLELIRDTLVLPPGTSGIASVIAKIERSLSAGAH